MSVRLLALLVLFGWCACAVLAQGSCADGCVWSCDSRSNQCASPMGLQVCINVMNLNKRNNPGLAANNAAIGQWAMTDRPTVRSGPMVVDGFAWFQLDSTWSAFSKTDGVLWFSVCPGTPPFVPPTMRPTAPPTRATTPQPPQQTNPPPTTNEPISQPSGQLLTSMVVGDQCNPSFDKCCTPEGLIAPAGTQCRVGSSQCILENSACDGRASNCPVVGAPDGQKCTTSVGQDGTCQSSICQAAVAMCAPAAAMFTNTCKTKCGEMGKKMKELCMCKSEGQTTAVCWPTARVEQFASGTGTDVAQFQSSCPDFCSCTCTVDGGTDSVAGASTITAAVCALAVSAAAML